MTDICGIDEAGRGPVIGPLVIAGAVIEEKDEQELKALGVKDSKLLTPQKREELFEKIKAIVKRHVILIIPPKEIDDTLNSPDTNLNWLEAQKSAEIINQLKPDEAILDCPSNNTKAYKAYVEKLLKPAIKNLKAEHKADVNYVVVSAASILAKVTRDREIEKIKKKLGQNIGSGYPSDPSTQEFLQKNWNKHPEVFRTSWESYKRVAGKKGQKGLTDF